MERDCTKGVEKGNADVEEGGRTFSREPTRASGFRPNHSNSPEFGWWSSSGRLDADQNLSRRGRKNEIFGMSGNMDL